MQLKITAHPQLHPGEAQEQKLEEDIEGIYGVT